MTPWLLAHQSSLATGCLLGSAGVAAAWESWRTRAALTRALAPRWLHSLALTALGAALVSACLPLTSLAAHAYAQRWTWQGLSALSLPVATVLGFLCLDLASYGQHRLSHASSWLWRIHQVHHSDRDLDWSTSLRHHPFEVLLGRAVQATVVVLCGIGPLAIALYAASATIVSVLSHANVPLTGWADRLLRRLVVTPDLHQIHHARDVIESDHNYATVLPLWDHLGATYRASADPGAEPMPLGIEGLGVDRDTSLAVLLLLPVLPLGVAASRFDRGPDRGPFSFPTGSQQEYP